MLDGLDAIEALLAGRAPVLIVLAGSNGAGKTTFFDEFLARPGLDFVNADQIAERLMPHAPASVSIPAAEAAAVLRRDLIAQQRSFVMETVLSDRKGAKLAELRHAQAQGFTVALIFIGIDSPELSEARVSGRVAHGGHDVPGSLIRDRFPRTLGNVARALRFVDAALLLDNSDAERPYQWVATWAHGAPVEQAAALPSWYPRSRDAALESASGGRPLR